MTSRTRPGPRSGTEAAAASLGPVSLALAALLAASASGCGSLSRPLFARHDATKAGTPEEQAALLGVEPTIAPLWLWSAQRQPGPEASLAVLERGRQFHPDDLELLLAQTELLHILHRDDRMLEVARTGLRFDCPPPLEAGLRWALVVAWLAAHDVGAAESEAVRLGGVRGVQPAQLADAWARIAATHEFLGHPEQADAALDTSLDWGPAGLLALREVSVEQPEWRAACESVQARAEARHPDHPDLVMQSLVTALLAQDAAAAQAALERLPAPLPERLQGPAEIQHVRVDLLAGRTEQALARLRARLDDDPADPGAVAALIECWRLRQVPPREEVRQRLAAAARLGLHPAVAGQAQALLRELSPPTGPQAAPEPPPADDTQPPPQSPSP